MIVGLDGRLLHGSTGIGRYTRSLFFEFARRRQQIDDIYYWLYDRAFPGTPDLQTGSQEDETRLSINSGETNSLPPHFRVVTTHCTTRILWTNLHVPRLLRQHAVDIYHGVCNFELPIRKVCKYVVTIHDLVPLFFPKLVPWKHLLFFRLFMKQAARNADIVITDSEHSKCDIMRYLAVPEEKIRVIYLGYTPQVLGDSQQDGQTQAVLERYDITQPYLLFVGVLEPKKNLERVVEAFALLRKMPDISPQLKLVVAGGKGWFYENVYRQVQDFQLEQHVIFTDFFPERDLPYLYAGAEVFVFPSIYEGFGLPVIEAMTYGVPVVTSTASSLPELVDKAGILVNPENPEAIRDGIAEVLLHPEKQVQMKREGRLQARRFTWQRTAEETYQVYQEVYNK